MKYLILIDKKFPFKSGESFLENEIDEISPYFDKIIIYPIDVCKSDNQTRDILSSSVCSRIINKGNIKFKKIVFFFKSILSVFDLKKDLNMHQRIIDSYFMNISKTQSKKIIKDLELFDFKDDDKIYIYSYWLHTTAEIACIIKKYFLSKNIKCKAISRAHGFDIYEERSKYKFIPRRLELITNLDSIFPCSKNGENYLKEKYKDYSDKIKVCYLGTYDHGLGKSSDDKIFRIVSCSRVVSLKRIELIIEALKLLKKENIIIEWTHIGDGPEFIKIKNMVNTDLKWMKVNLLGYLNNKDVYNFYLNNYVDLFVNVSSTEGLPVSIMEAISFGIPVVATDVGGTSEIVINENNGFLIKKDFEVTELAKLIKKVADMENNDYINIRKNARNMWVEKYQAKKNYKVFAESIIE